MRRRVKRRILAAVSITLVALVAAYCTARFAFGFDVLDRTGFATEDGTTRYLDYWGRPQTGWQEIENKTYYFAPEEGNMVTGWQDVDGARYYFGQDGAKACGWLELEGKRYWLGEDGALTTGWLNLEDKTYYLAPEGGAATVGWLQLDGKQYYFAENGTTVSGWLEIDGIRYRFNEDGSAVTGWFEDGTRYYFGEDGKPQSGWLEWEQKTYYLKEDGSVTVGWMTVEEDRYYFLPTGRMAIGEVEVDGVARFFDSSGKETLMCNPWHAIPEDFVLDLVDINGKKIDRNAKEPMQQMIDAAKADGVKIVNNNSYRSHATQKGMWNKRVSERMEAGMTRAQAEKETGKSLAIPGHSEHETGLAFDVNNGKNVYKWLGEHCWDYGFILRYPDDRMSITGIIYEPWHFRYVGTELSLELKELGLCMEEYFDMLTEQQKAIAD